MNAGNTHTDDTVILLEDTAPSPLKLVPTNDKAKSHVLHTLDGPCMSYKVPTRNDRLYTEAMIDKLMNGEYIQELIKTNNFFGEPSHPMSVEKRLDLYYPYVSHRCYNFRKVPEEGCWYCSVDILDTPYGKILNTLVDVGALLGISSRGSGRVITNNHGERIIDPDSYYFVTFDLVHMPGLKAGRLTPVDDSSGTNQLAHESLIPKLTHQIDESIQNHDKKMLESIAPLFDYLDTSDPSIKLLQEKLNDNLTDKSESPVIAQTDTRSVTNDLVEAYCKVNELKGELAQRNTIIDQLNEKLSTQSEVIATKSSDSNIDIPKLMKNLSNSINIIKVQQSKIKQLSDDNSKLSGELDTIVKSMDSVRDKFKNYRKDAQSQLSTTVQSLNDKIEDYESQLSDKDDEITKLHSVLETYKTSSKSKEREVSKNSSMIESLNKRLTSSSRMIDNLNSTNEDLNNKLIDVTNRYVSCRCSQLGLNESLVTSTIRDEIESSDIDAIEDSLMESYKSKKSIGRQSSNSSLVDSLVPHKVSISRDKFTASHDKPLLESDNRGNTSDHKSDSDILADICSSVRIGQVKQFQ